MPWFLKQGDGLIYGPHTEETLREWAAHGRIGVEDEVSQDEVTWYPATELEALEMNWLVRLPDGSVYGPVHVKALGVLARLGQAAADAEVANWRTAQTTTLWEALAGTPGEADRETGEAPVPLQAALCTLTASRDHHAREARKWKDRFEQESRRAAQREEELSRQLEELRKNESDTRQKLEQAERQAARLSEDLQKARKEMEESAATDPEKRAITWMSSYQDISLQYDELMSRFAAKEREVQDAREACARVEEEIRQRLQQTEAALLLEKEESGLVRQRLAEVEESHAQMATSYRERKDRQARPEELLAPDPSAAAADPPGPPPEA